MKYLPLARNENIVVQDLKSEILIYDLVIHKAFCLNDTSAVVFRACDGKTTFEELATNQKFTSDLIHFALSELKKENLLQDADSLISPFSGMSRREVIRKVGFASIVSLPVISGLVAPTVVMAQSGCVGTIAPNTPVNCTRGVEGCTQQVALQSCASCSAFTVSPSPVCPNPTFPFLCICA